MSTLATAPIKIFWARGPFGPYYFQAVSATPTGRPRVRELRTFIFTADDLRRALPVPNAFVTDRVFTTSIRRSGGRTRVYLPGLGPLLAYRPQTLLEAALAVPFV